MFIKLLNFYNAHRSGVTFGSGLALGLLIGLLIGWLVWPTSYYNATPAMLRQDFRDDYLTWVAREYAASGDVEQAKARLGLELWRGDPPQQVLQDLAERRGGEDGEHLRALAQALEAVPLPEQTPLLTRLRPFFLACGLALVAIGVVGLLLFVVRRRRPREAGEVSERAVASYATEPTSWAGEEALPLAQFVTTYTLGDDFYDPSFSIETETGDFLGECGVGISETLGVGDPKKVTALEVWLFDKNDIRTETKVLMSRYAYEDEALRARLASKGDLILAEPGKEIVLETATLVLRARIAELAYWQGGQLPAESVFERVRMELGAWAKPGAEGAVAPEPPSPLS